MDAVPGSARTQTHPASRVIVTKTDHDFVQLSIKRLGKAVAGAAVAVAAATALATPPQAATITTTYHHPCYDITQSAFVDTEHLKAGDELQSSGTAIAEITSTHLFQHQTTTYDLTVDGVHTYDVVAGSVPLLVHNCGTGSPASSAANGERLHRQLSAESGRLPGARSLDDLFTTPSLLNGDVTPDPVTAFCEGVEGWQVGHWAKETTPAQDGCPRVHAENDDESGRMLRWPPGGGHHGPDPYWRVIGVNGDLGGIIR